MRGYKPSGCTSMTYALWFAALASALTSVTATAAGDTRSSPIRAPELADASERWILTSLYSHSQLSNNRGPWNVGEVELDYRLTPETLVGGLIEIRHRSPDTDTRLGALISHQLNRALEIHGAVRLTPASDFSARQTYAAGLEWRSRPIVSVLFDYEYMDFPAGPIHQFKPGLRHWFSEATFVTARYSIGRAFHTSSFGTGSLQLNLGLEQGRRLVAGYAHGIDPEKDSLVPGVIRIRSDTYSVFYHHPLYANCELIVGMEHQDLRNTYSRTTGTIGFSTRF